MGSSNPPEVSGQSMAGIGRPAWPRPAGLEITPIWLNFAHVDPSSKQSPKLVEHVNISENYINMVPKV